MMKYTKEEILNALQIIKDTCEESKCCSCPFGNIHEMCVIQDAPPSHWSFADEEKLWRAFK